MENRLAKGKILPVYFVMILTVWFLHAPGHSAAQETALHAAPDLFPVTMHATPDHAPIVLVEDGRPVATICILDVPDVPGRTQAFRQALDELQTAIELTTGVRLPVVRGEIREPAIILGNGPAAAAAGLVGVEMPREGFHIMTAPNRVYIVGHDDPRWELDALPGDTALPFQGTAWGIFEFLERFVGVRWYWSTVTYVPDFRGIPPFSQPSGRSVQRRSNLVVPPVHLSDQPVFAMRGPEHPWPRHLARLQAAQRLVNTHEITISVHAPNYWGAFPEIRDHYPEVFELRPDGSRCDRLLCFSNPKTLEVYLNEIARVYDAGEPVDRRRIGINGDAITVSPWDRHPNCQCEDCREMVGENRWELHRSYFSEVITGFVQRLAHAVKERWPDKTVIYLPYQNYMSAPAEGVDFPDNVEVKICGMGGIAAYRTPQIRAYFQKQLDRWYAYTGHKVQTWEYSMYPRHRLRAVPYQFPNVLQSFYRDNSDKLIGSFLNAAYDHRTTRHITAYIWARLLWNPDIDIGATLDEYARRMYGDAADDVREMVQILIDGWE